MTNIKFKLKSLSKTNKNLAINALSMLIIRGGSLILSIVYMPLYMNYFSNATVLGLWFTILTVLNWILTFDLGIGNGLRNHLTIALSKNDKNKVKELISSSYVLLGSIVCCICFGVFIGLSYVNLNSFFNISEDLIAPNILTRCISISAIGVLMSFFLRLISSILYALQKAAFTNLMSFTTSLLNVIYLFIVPPSLSVEINLEKLSIYYAVVTNLPYIIATILVFTTSSLKYAVPSISHYNHYLARKILSLGITFLCLQLLYMIISVTNEWFISKFYAPQYCVDYNIYYKLFSLVGSLYMLTLTPFWSAITKAYAEGRYVWIMKLQRILYISVILLMIIQCLIVPLSPWIINFWLGEKAIIIDYKIAWIFVIYSIIFTWIAVQSTFVTGLGTLKVQMWGYSIAVFIKIGSIILLSHHINNWAFIVFIDCVALLPYCIWQPISLNQSLRKIIM